MGGSGTKAPWPMFMHDRKHTGRSPFMGAREGRVRWRLGWKGGIYSSFVIGSDGTIYFGGFDRRKHHHGYYLYAVGPDGSLKWRFRVENLIESTPAIGDDGTIYAGSSDGFFYAVNPNGTLKWKLETEKRAGIYLPIRLQ
ncbi:MAG: PQQ-like beta-propeller repeat protein [Candidatus Brockarchaeota archaeon]|nr:PQQ-like beta-propeller repeat protein [Candidatus Brockarchaeota archaeon]